MTGTPEAGAVRVERVGPGGSVARFSLDRPAALNSLTPTMVRELVAASLAADQDPAVAVVLLDSGTSPSFCAGADLASTTDDTLLEPLPGTVRLCAKPVIAAVRGWTVGAGLKLVCAADLVVAARDTVLWAPETQVGVLGTGDIAHRLLRRLPYRIAMELVLTGTRLGAARALELGFVNEVVPNDDLDERAVVLACLVVNSNVDIRWNSSLPSEVNYRVDIS